MARDIRAAWATIEGWFERHAPGAFVPRPPASQADIDAVEAAIGYALPDDYEASLAIHDGIEINETLDWFYGYWMAPVASCLEAWTGAREYDDPDADLDETVDDAGVIRAVLSHGGRFPVLGTQYWDYDVIYLDMHPGPSGQTGQVVALVAECDLVLMAGSFGALLERIAELMASDLLTVMEEDEMRRVVAREDGRALGDLLADAPPPA